MLTPIKTVEGVGMNAVGWSRGLGASARARWTLIAVGLGVVGSVAIGATTVVASATVYARVGMAGQIAISGADGKIRVVASDGSEERTLGPGLDPSWSPDGSRILFWRGVGNTSGCENDPGFGASAGACAGDVWMMNADGSGQRLLIPRAFKPGWAPDGRHIVYNGPGTASPNGAIFVADADGRHERQITSGAEDSNARWSPDGRTIVFVRCCEWSATPAWVGTSRPYTELFSVAPDGRQLRGLFGFAGLSAWSPAWSPDGRRIAFTVTNYGAEQSSIDVLNLDEGTAQQITPNAEGATWMQNMRYAPAWSPDGRRIAYTFDPDGPQGVSNAGDGRMAGFALGGPQPGVIHLVNPDGSGDRALVQGSWPSFEPRGAARPTPSTAAVAHGLGGIQRASGSSERAIPLTPNPAAAWKVRSDWGGGGPS